MRIELGDYTILDKGKDNRNITKYLLEMLVDNKNLCLRCRNI